MGLLEIIKEWFRPELEIDPDIVEREEEFSADDPNRERWILEHTYLCEGDLEVLEGHPDYNELGISKKFAYFLGGKQPKKVRVQVELSDEEINMSIERVEKKLKYELCI